MIVRVVVVLAIVLAGCGRPLTPGEREFARALHGDALDPDRVRLIEGAPLAPVTFRYRARPRTSCRERILPPVTDEFVTSKPAAVTLFSRVLFTRDWYAADYLPDYPDRMDLIAAMLLGHELTHVWQWQNRAQTRYNPLRAAGEHNRSDDPYLFEMTDAPDLLDYAYEQQGAIVEEYICCRALAPDAARTKRLHAMLQSAFPVADLPATREQDVMLPWRGAELNGICD